VTCLFSATGYDLKALLRNGATDEEIIEIVSSIWRKRTDRYSDERLEAMNSGRGYRAKDHKKIEMITLGG
jgi:cyclic pyranopterin phosphate synthase